MTEIVNHDADVKNRLKVLFLANFWVSLGERIYPTATLSEQISTSGKEEVGLRLGQSLPQQSTISPGSGRNSVPVSWLPGAIAL